VKVFGWKCVYFPDTIDKVKPTPFVTGDGRWIEHMGIGASVPVVEAGYLVAGKLIEQEE
jgi:hypothetical protein